MVTAYYGKNGGGGILRRKLLPQFFTNSHEIWHRCLPWGVDVQDTFFDSGRKCVAMVMAYVTLHHKTNKKSHGPVLCYG